MLVELGVAAIAAAAAVGIRLALSPFLGDVAPYTFVFAGVTIATIAGGWRSGLMSIAIGQWLTWRMIVRPDGLLVPGYDQPLAGLTLATISQLMLVVAIAFYQREVDKGTAEREQRLTMLDDVLREIDHRTRNNYQTVLAMIELQARRTTNDGVREALRQVADRIQAIAHASQHLAVQSAEFEGVRLGTHLSGLVEQIERGLSRDDVRVACDVEDVTASVDTATSVSIIVNELVTNALKHAFNGEESGEVRVLGKTNGGYELVVADNGRGFQASPPNASSGLGSKLVESFVRQLGADHQVTSSEAGTIHRLVIPKLDA